MLDLKAVAADPDGFERRLARRSPEAARLLDPVKPLLARRRELNLLLEKLKKEQSTANARVGQLMRTDKVAGEAARAEGRAHGGRGGDRAAPPPRPEPARGQRTGRAGRARQRGGGAVGLPADLRLQAAPALGAGRG